MSPLAVGDMIQASPKRNCAASAARQESTRTARGIARPSRAPSTAGSRTGRECPLGMESDSRTLLRRVRLSFAIEPS
jgi:hypothetical protein